MDIRNHEEAAKISKAEVNEELEISGDMVIMDIETARAERHGRRSGDSGMFAEMPWYVRAIAVFGVPSVIAMFLVYQMAGTHFTDVEATKSILTAHVEATNEIQKKNQEHQKELEKILRAICVNGALERDQRLGCLE